MEIQIIFGTPSFQEDVDFNGRICNYPFSLVEKGEFFHKDTVTSYNLAVRISNNAIDAFKIREKLDHPRYEFKVLFGFAFDFVRECFKDDLIPQEQNLELTIETGENFSEGFPYDLQKIGEIIGYTIDV